MVKEIKKKSFRKKIQDLRNYKVGSFLFMAILIATSAVTFFLVQSRQEVRQRAEDNSTEILMSFDKKAANPGDTLILTVSVDSHANLINEVSLNFAYPAEKVTPKLEFDTTSFNNSTEELASGGLIKFDRTTDKPIDGKNTVAKIRFSVLQPVTNDEIFQLADSSVVGNNVSMPIHFTSEINTNPPQTQTNLFDSIMKYIQGFLGGK